MADDAYTEALIQEQEMVEIEKLTDAEALNRAFHSSVEKPEIINGIINWFNTYNFITEKQRTIIDNFIYYTEI